MSANLALTKIKLGDSATPANNFLISVPDIADGTLTIEREDGTDVLTIDALGKLKFPSMALSLGEVGSIEFPGGTILKGGSIPSGGDTDIYFPVPFPNVCTSVVVIPSGTVVLVANELLSFAALAKTKEKFYLQRRYFTAASGVLPASQPAYYIAMGN